MRPRSLVLVAMFGAMACSGKDAAPKGEVSRSMAPGDTLRVTSTSAAWGKAPIKLDFTAVSDSIRFERQARLSWGTGNLVWAGERNEIRAIDLTTGAVAHRMGRDGKGPGEFQGIDGLYVWGSDSVMAFDAFAGRLTVMDTSGRVIRTMPVTPPERYRPGFRFDLVPCNGEAVMQWNPGMVAPDAPPDTMLITVTSLGTAQHRRIGWMLTAPWTHQGSVFAPKELYSPRNVVARGIGCGRLALTQTLKPCVTLIDLTTPDSTRVACWWREPAKASSSVSDPAQLKGLGMASTDSTMLHGIITLQQVGEHRSALEALRVDDQGRIWARITDPESPFHPYVLARAPEKRSPLTDWDVLAPDGAVLGTVQVSSMIEVAMVRGRTVLGFRTNDDGETELVRAELPAEAQ